MGMMRRFKNMMRRADIDHEIATELQSHIALRIDDNLAAGMSPTEASRDALLRFGNPASTKERVTAADATLSLEGLFRDIRYAARLLRRSPGFALTAILTLALGIGANMVVFGVLNALILRPLNLPGAEHLFQVAQLQQGDTNQSYPDFIDFRNRNMSFSDMASYRLALAGLSTGGSARKSWEYAVSGNYFDMLGIQPQLGRFFHANDEHGPNSAPYIVLSDALWRTRFNASPNVVGMTVDLNKHDFTIIGVAPKSFNGTELLFWPDFWIPMVNAEQIEGYSFLNKRGNHSLYVIGMLKPGMTIQQATDNLTAVAHQLAREYPATNDGMGARLVKPGLLGDTLGGPARPFLAVIMLLALLVLAAAGANLAGIFAARAADRSRELAIRLSIGSTRWRILRQVLTEAVLISIAGGIVGTFLASALLSILSRWQPIAQFPIHVTVVPDMRVYLIALLLTFASGILPGLLPARQVWQTDAMQAMKSVGPGTGLLRRPTLRDLLLVIQITLCALLVTASLVALRGMIHSLRAPFGFVPEGRAEKEIDHTAQGNQRSVPSRAQRVIWITRASRVGRRSLPGPTLFMACIGVGSQTCRAVGRKDPACEVWHSRSSTRAYRERRVTSNRRLDTQQG